MVEGCEAGCELVNFQLISAALAKRGNRMEALVPAAMAWRRERLGI
jgi:hypothetical protein